MISNSKVALLAAVLITGSLAGVASAQTAGTTGGVTTAPSTTTVPSTARSPAMAPNATTAAPAAVTTTNAPSRTSAAPVAGANSFTEAEARRRIQDKGFGQVADLKKDSKGVWHGTSTKDGKPTNVALDYQGNVVSQ